MVIVGYTAFTEGDPNLLAYGIDSSAYLCGTKASKTWTSDAAASAAPDFSTRKYLHWSRVQDYGPNMASAQSVCVESCPVATITTEGSTSLTQSSQTYTCQYYIKSSVAGTLSGVGDWDVNYYAKLASAQQTTSNNGEGPCYPNFFVYTPILNRCVPVPSDAMYTALETSSPSAFGGSSGLSVSILKALINALDTGSGGVSDYIEDVYKAWMAIVVCGFVCGLVCSCLWITFIRYFAGVMAWMTIFSINAILWLVTLFCAMRGGLIGSDSVGVESDVDDSAKDNQDVFVGLTYGLLVICAIVFVFTLLMIRRILIAVAVLKVAAQARSPHTRSHTTALAW
jgi:choline transporter-like protein 2/4/5